MARDKDFGLSGSVHDTARERRHQKRVDAMPWGLRQQDEALRHPTPSVRRDEPAPLTDAELLTLQGLLTRLRPSEAAPFPEDWLRHVTYVLRLASYLHSD